MFGIDLLSISAAEACRSRLSFSLSEESQMMKFPRTRHKLPVLLDCLFPAILVVYVYKQATWCSIFTELHVLGDVSKDH
jgi:hypothetical protein